MKKLGMKYIELDVHNMTEEKREAFVDRHFRNITEFGTSTRRIIANAMENELNVIVDYIKDDMCECVRIFLGIAGQESNIASRKDELLCKMQGYAYELGVEAPRYYVSEINTKIS